MAEFNIVEALLGADEEELLKEKTGTYKSKRLGRLAGMGEPFTVEIKEIPYRRASEHLARIAKNGELDGSRKVTAETLVILDGVTNVDFRNKELQAKFHCATPTALIEKIMGNEVGELSDAILGLSDARADNEADAEEEVKN